MRGRSDGPRLLRPAPHPTLYPPWPGKFTHVSAGGQGHAAAPLSTGFAGPPLRSGRSAVTASHRRGEWPPRSSTNKTGLIGPALFVEDRGCKRPEPRGGVNGGRRPPAEPARSAIDAEHGSGIRPAGRDGAMRRPERRTLYGAAVSGSKGDASARRARSRRNIASPTSSLPLGWTSTIAPSLGLAPRASQASAPSAIR